ncbi:MAG: aldo/keto reductase [Lachnospiraceae bacterium]|nr:aldo/keto reductase [Lachnospiraceae bacterium]
MKYRTDKHGDPVSILGYGCMRFTRKGTGIDLEKAEKELLCAYEAGVNYFDTAYLYPGSEAAVGEIFARNGLLEKVKIATKLPQYLVRKAESIDKYFDEELSRLKTDYVDYYLMHMLTDLEGWNRLKRLGIEDWIARQKAAGRIRNIGFSFHGNTDVFQQILNDYDWDMCQIQYNYLDEVTQAGRAGLRAAAAKGIPVVIMEPLRGGRLVNGLPEKARKLVADDAKGRSAAELAFRWLWDQPEVTCVLSGMNSLAMVQENCLTASESEPGMLTEEDHALIAAIRDAINEKTKVPCTGCRYCMPCPQGIDIPGTFRCYNSMYIESKMSGRTDYLKTVALRKDSVDPKNCVGCGKCERICPQGIHVIEELKTARKALLPPPMAVAGAVGRKFFIKK